MMINYRNKEETRNFWTTNYKIIRNPHFPVDNLYSMTFNDFFIYNLLHCPLISLHFPYYQTGHRLTGNDENSFRNIIVMTNHRIYVLNFLF